MKYADSLAALREHAEAYIRQYGNLDVRQDYVSPDGFPLGGRLHNARAARKLGTLSAERSACLDALDVDWEPRAPEKWLADARAYARQNGGLKVHQEYVTPTGLPLGLRIRSARISLKVGAIKPRLQEALGLIDPCWHIAYKGPDPDRESDCVLPGCREGDLRRRLCERHLGHLYTHGAPVFTYAPDVACPVVACVAPPNGQGWCDRHQAQMDDGHGRTAYRIRGRWRGLECGGRCEVCLADWARQQGEQRRKNAEERLPFDARREFVAMLWEGRTLDQACEQVGLTSRELFNLRSLPEFVEAVDVALMVMRDPSLRHGTDGAYRARCRCPGCREAKAKYR